MKRFCNYFFRLESWACRRLIQHTKPWVQSLAKEEGERRRKVERGGRRKKGRGEGREGEEEGEGAEEGGERREEYRI